jgi:poly(A) polymerase
MLVKHHVKDADTIVTEVATFRSDGVYSDSRRPDAVTFSTPREDASRRDFTVNALFLDPLDTPHDGDGPLPNGFWGGRVIDYVGGLDDLRARVLRAVGDADARLNEDHLRALRATRLAARLGFTIEPTTASAITRHASGLRGVSRERVGEELRMMFASATRAHAARLLHGLGLEQQVVGAPGEQWSLGDDRAPTLEALPIGASFALALAAWALDLGVAMQGDGHDRFIENARDALCLSNDEREELNDTLRALRVFHNDWASLRVAAKKRLASGRVAQGAMELLSVQNPMLASFIQAEIQSLLLTPSGLAPLPLLTGDTLISHGFKPGPHFRRVLEEVYDAQLEERVSNLDQALELARKLCV